jgi:hypothetical protein
LSIFCTISTRSHLFKSLALADSLNRFGYQLAILVVDELDYSIHSNKKDVLISNLTAIKESTGIAIIKKYRHKKDKLRWALKPIWLIQLLHKYEKVIYVDNDTFFYADPSFLFDELNHHKILLSPHFYPAEPENKQNWLEANFKVGLYNAGFIGANKQAKEILHWWSKCCLYKITKSTSRGLFDDQKYLDLLPIKFENILIIKHKGCNLAGWNSINYSLEGDKMSLIINGKYPIIFIHFANLSLREFSKNGSKLHSYYQFYTEELRKYKHDYTFKKTHYTWYQLTSYFNFLLWKIKRLFD